MGSQPQGAWSARGVEAGSLRPAPMWREPQGGLCRLGGLAGEPGAGSQSRGSPVGEGPEPQQG